MKILRWTGLALAIVVLVVACLIAWIVGTRSGTRWAVQTAAGVLGDRFAVARIEGTLAGPLVLDDLYYRDADAGVDLTVRRVSLDLALRRLLGMTVDVSDAAIEGVRLDLTPTAPREEEQQPAQSFSLEAPIDIVVRRFVLTDAAVTGEGEPVVTIDRVDLVARWIGETIAIERFDLRSPQGEAHFAANVAQREFFIGDGEGRFRWRQGDLLYAGTLASTASDRRAELSARMTSPVTGTLTASVEQLDALPWRLRIEVPRFDPREELMPDSALESLAVSLEGSGTRHGGDIAGRVEVNGESLLLDQVRVQLQEEIVTLGSRIRIAESHGALQVDGNVKLDAEPWHATVRAQWDPLTLPERWVGQTLATQGTLSFEGNPDRFTTQGALKIGPPERLADIALDVAGSTQALEIRELSIRHAGELTARGNVQLAPSIAWQLAMQAREFDPGVFLAQWPGDIAFDLRTSGTLVEGVPQATLELDRLRGKLRQRELSGSAGLALSERCVLSGTLRLASGQSRIEVRGAEGDVMNAVATLDIPSLTDWVPDSEGRLNATIEARGAWPKLDIKARADGSDLRVGDIRVAGVDMDLEAHDPTSVSGWAQVSLADVSAAGMSFRTLRARAEGSEAEHVLTLSSEGDPLSAGFQVQGGRTPGGWAGAIERLVLDVTDVARLSLERPVHAELDEGAMRFSQACLVDADIRLCASGASESDGSLQASYSLSGVPLGLAKVYAPPDLPLDFSGTIEGSGEIRRTAEGQLNGQARLSSTHARIAATEHDDETLLEFRNFQLVAQLDGAQARTTLASELNEGGSIRGELALNGLGEMTTGMQGELSMAMPSLATVALFVPQVANVEGRVDVHAIVGGTLDAPEVSGELRATQLAAHIPELGLQLRDGEVQVTPQPNGDVALTGRIASGEGEVTFDGGWQRVDERLLVTVRGNSFLAADIPAAKVLVDPDLTFTQERNRMSLKGDVVIPTATIDLQRMPRGGGPRARQASSDVVVVDEPVIEEKRQSERTPLFAEVTVTLGDKVAITGFGLDATVKGKLTVRETPGEPTLGSGDISIAGTYKAYGQDLTIEQGRVLYASTPIDNPRLNIVAVRTIEEQNVRAGLRIGGTARAPQMTVFSDPAMGQAEALAYLVTGKPLDAVGEEDGDMMQTAARSLGTAAGGLLAKRIGNRFGVDEVSIKESEGLEGAAFTVGQYLSPRLYLSYGVGLFEPGEVITLRYSLTRALALQALSGPEDMRAGVIWRVER